MGSESYHMSQKELQRLPVIEAVWARGMAQMEAAEGLGLSPRQVRRLQGRLQAEGPVGLRRRNRSRPSNRRYSHELKSRVLHLIREKYADFGPTLACEKLGEVHKIVLSDETVRHWMRTDGLMSGRRRPMPHRQWRERRACYGQMVQMDGSHHDWLEGRGPRLVLMGVLYQGRDVRYQAVPARPPPVVATPQEQPLPRRLGGPGYKPAADNPWRTFTFSRRLKTLHPHPSNRTF